MMKNILPNAVYFILLCGKVSITAAIGTSTIHILKKCPPGSEWLTVMLMVVLTNDHGLPVILSGVVALSGFFSSFMEVKKSI